MLFVTSVFGAPILLALLSAGIGLLIDRLSGAEAVAAAVARPVPVVAVPSRVP